MATDLNIVALVGRLTRPVEMRYTNSGTAIANFSLAVNRKKKVNEEWVEYPSFFDCTYFGKGADAVSQYLTKGQQVSIQGHLEQQTWQDATTGSNRSKVAIIVQNLTLLGSKNSQEQGITQDHRQNYGQQAPQQQIRQAPQHNYYGKQPQKQMQQPSQNYGQQIKQPSQNYGQQQFSGPEDFADDIPF